MPLENANFIAELNAAWPLGSDGVNTSDDHHRNTKRAVQQSFPNINAEVECTAQDLNQLAGTADDGTPLNPVGTVLQGAWLSPPDGYLACDGAVIDPIYTDLISLVGASTPDLRGRFIRGWNSGQVDPDGARAALSQQSEEFKAHSHSTPRSTDGGNNPVFNSGQTQSSTLATSSAGGDETRPVNTALMFVIKW